jgi:hypothetical protein
MVSLSGMSFLKANQDESNSFPADLEFGGPRMRSSKKGNSMLSTTSSFSRNARMPHINLAQHELQRHYQRLEAVL